MSEGAGGWPSDGIDISFSGPVNGLYEPDPSGAYMLATIVSKRAGIWRFKLSVGAAEVLAAELAGLLDGPTPSDLAHLQHLAHQADERCLTLTRENEALTERVARLEEALEAAEVELDEASSIFSDLGELRASKNAAAAADNAHAVLTPPAAP